MLCCEALTLFAARFGLGMVSNGGLRYGFLLFGTRIVNEKPDIFISDPLDRCETRELDLVLGGSCDIPLRSRDQVAFHWFCCRRSA
jgi:hypothetical protein